MMHASRAVISNAIAFQWFLFGPLLYVSLSFSVLASDFAFRMKTKNIETSDTPIYGTCHAGLESFQWQWSGSAFCKAASY
jgi:hypothetical protein